MSDFSLPQFVEEISQVSGSALAEIPQLLPAFLNLLVRGYAVRPIELAEAIDLPPAEVEAWLSGHPNIERDEEGNIEGYGLTLRKTAHAVEIDGRQFYAWCALDTLIFPTLVGRAAHINSSCAATGAAVHLTVTPDGIVNVNPVGTVVSLLVPEPSADIRGVFCNHVHFFASASVAENWVAVHPGVQVLPVEAAYQVGQEMCRQHFQPLQAPVACCDASAFHKGE
jgi:alkylmercury lyase